MEQSINFRGDFFAHLQAFKLCPEGSPSEVLGEIFKSYIDLNDRKILVENFTDNDLGTLYGAAELIFKGWPNEALPFSIKKKSIISGFFDRFFN